MKSIYVSLVFWVRSNHSDRFLIEIEKEINETKANSKIRLIMAVARRFIDFEVHHGASMVMTTQKWSECWIPMKSASLSVCFINLLLFFETKSQTLFCFYSRPIFFFTEPNHKNWFWIHDSNGGKMKNSDLNRISTISRPMQIHHICWQKIKQNNKKIVGNKNTSSFNSIKWPGIALIRNRLFIRQRSWSWSIICVLLLDYWLTAWRTIALIAAAVAFFVVDFVFFYFHFMIVTAAAVIFYRKKI